MMLGLLNLTTQIAHGLRLATTIQQNLSKMRSVHDELTTILADATVKSEDLEKKLGVQGYSTLADLLSKF